ncbi:23S rRNA (adenine(2030)-N(6))-methyltransferase RlmJ [Pseudomonas sp. C27(2019)]|uniref:23S rRNA (adenine(2030)-N(6))-methyltransferase RlmJ n=1 Tax=Pseudomonas sp. C27(2019) TaxID=2604941 RepID=UPI001246B145|nr:23S rRNA (adenine(2030)-N(6))-methyltransferase RlmJ [Pseudomonas sp. C27(2019)]QEY57828.1 23S rRNA (adenine(2030)-N(6))-methyltransferase RlmJ [Pseudomonas sp. C27(2019)]
MNYRHAYHAGNHADVLKHWLLTRCIALMQKKSAPIAYIDTHAGIGLYDLQGEEALKTDEWREGIARLWGSDQPLLVDYLHAVSELNDDDELRYYPGSPELVRCLTRSQDHLYLNEKHPTDGQLLKENMRIDLRVTVHLGEGWHVPRALLPTAEKRLLMLIDPPFEEGDDLQSCVRALEESLARMRQAIVCLWYPVKDVAQLRRFYQQLQKSSAPSLLRVELYVHKPDDATRLNGSGMVICNPPWGLEDELRQLLPWLAETLQQSAGGWRLDWLIAD